MPTRSELRSYLQDIDPYEFEELVAEIWEQKFGYTSKVTTASQDRGIDIMATQDKPLKQKILIQTKLYQKGNKVSSREIREYATLYQQDETADRVVLICTGGFTRQAEKLADDLRVDIFDREDIVEWLTDDDVTCNVTQQSGDTNESNATSESSSSEKTVSEEDPAQLFDDIRKWTPSEFLGNTTSPEPRKAMVNGPVNPDSLYNSLLFHIRVIDEDEKLYDTSEAVNLPFDDSSGIWYAKEGIHYIEGLYQIATKEQEVLDRMDEFCDNTNQIIKINEENHGDLLVGSYEQENQCVKIVPEKEFRTTVRIITDVFENSIRDIDWIEIESESSFEKASKRVFA